MIVNVVSIRNSKITQVWLASIDFIIEKTLRTHADLFPGFWVLYMLVSSPCYFMWMIMMGISC